MIKLLLCASFLGLLSRAANAVEIINRFSPSDDFYVFFKNDAFGKEYKDLALAGKSDANVTPLFEDIKQDMQARKQDETTIHFGKENTNVVCATIKMKVEDDPWAMNDSTLIAIDRSDKFPGYECKIKKIH